MEKRLLGYYRYRIQEEGDNIRVIFLDCRRTLRVFRTFLIVSIIVSLAGASAVFFAGLSAFGKSGAPICREL